MKRRILHVDMDAFFAAVEQRDDPKLRGKPVIIGADPEEGRGRGVVSTCSYEARRFGVRSAMPVSTAFRACPKGVFIRPDMQKYSEESTRIMGIFRGFSPFVEQLSIDEAFLDCTGMGHLFKDDFSLGRAVKEKIFKETGLTASVGIASNKSVAKIASDLQKPDGLVICPPGGEKEFLAPLDVSRIWGAGEKTVRRLKAMGINTIGDLAETDPSIVGASLGKTGRHMWQLANGIDPRPLSTESERKSISEERTFLRDTSDEDFLKKTVFDLSRKVAETLRRKKMSARTVNLKIRTEDFVTLTRSCTLDWFFDDTETLRRTACALMGPAALYGGRIRLVGVGVSNITREEAYMQGDLFDDGPAKARKVDAIIDRVSRKFGRVIDRGTFVKKGKDASNNVDKK